MKTKKNYKKSYVSYKKFSGVSIFRGLLQKKPNQEIVITDHCLRRWRERVGDVAGKEQVHSIIEKSRIRYLFNDYFIVNEDIIVAIKVEKKEQQSSIILTTTLGSCSLNPMLYNLESYVRNKYKYGKINLQVV